MDVTFTLTNIDIIKWVFHGVSKNNGTPKSSILIGFSIINHPFWGTLIFGNTQISSYVIDTYNHHFYNWPLVENFFT